MDASVSNLTIMHRFSVCLFLCIFVLYTNLHHYKERLETICTRWWGPGTCSYGAVVRLSARGRRSSAILSRSPRCHLIPCVRQTFHCSGYLDMLQATAAILSLSSILCHSTISLIVIINFSLSSAMPVHLNNQCFTFSTSSLLQFLHTLPSLLTPHHLPV